MPDQKAFSAALLDPEAAVPEGIVRPDGTRATKRFNVYRNNVITSLISAMGEAFPTIKKLVGEAFFDAMAGVFVRQHPPTSPLIMFYGDAFPEFLQNFEPVASLPYLPDIARLEHARRKAYHAADAAAIDPNRLAEVPPGDLPQAIFKLAPSVRVIRSDHPILSIWRHNMTADQSPVAPAPEDVLVFRPTDTVEMTQVPPGGSRLLEALLSADTLGCAAEAAASEASDFDLGEMIGLMLQTGIISDINIRHEG